MGKYDEVLKRLPKLEPEGGEYQDRVNAAKVKWQGLNPTQLAAVYIAARREKDEHEALEKDLNLNIEALTQLTCEAFEAQETQSVKLEDGSSVARELEPYPGTNDKEAFRLWCLEQGLERSMHLNPQTMKSLIKERLLSGQVVECQFCKGEGIIAVVEKLAEGQTNECQVCGGSGAVVAPGVRVFTKAKLVARGR